MSSRASIIPKELYVTVRIRLNPDRRLPGRRRFVSTGSSPRYQAATDAAVRAVLQASPTPCCGTRRTINGNYMDIDFDPKQIVHSLTI